MLHLAMTKNMHEDLFPFPCFVCITTECSNGIRGDTVHSGPQLSEHGLTVFILTENRLVCLSNLSDILKKKPDGTHAIVIGKKCLLAD